jgi:hypothetical protein
MVGRAIAADFLLTKVEVLDVEFVVVLVPNQGTIFSLLQRIVEFCNVLNVDKLAPMLLRASFTIRQIPHSIKGIDYGIEVCWLLMSAMGQGDRPFRLDVDSAGDLAGARGLLFLPVRLSEKI